MALASVQEVAEKSNRASKGHEKPNQHQVLLHRLSLAIGEDKLKLYELVCTIQ